MEFIRPVDWSHADIRLENGYAGQVLYQGEDCVIVATRVPPAAEGPRRHIHPSDQVYVVTEGEIAVELGREQQKVGKYGAIFIPAGTPHHNWNPSDLEEMHIEIIAPNVRPGASITEFTDSTEAPGKHFVSEVNLANQQAVGQSRGMSNQWLINHSTGHKKASVYLAEVQVGGRGPNLHTHQFDQFYFVLEGALNVEIGLRQWKVSPNTLVVLPAEVPHRQWNDGLSIERHLAILVPEPPDRSEPWDVEVELRELPKQEVVS